MSLLALVDVATPDVVAHGALHGLTELEGVHPAGRGSGGSVGCAGDHLLDGLGSHAAPWLHRLLTRTSATDSSLGLYVGPLISSDICKIGSCRI